MIEPVAWLVPSKGDENFHRIWWRDRERAEAWIAKHPDCKLVQLYAAPVPPADAEDCAKIAEGHVGMWSKTGEHDRNRGYDEACRDIAKAIRDTYRCGNE